MTNGVEESLIFIHALSHIGTVYSALTVLIDISSFIYRLFPFHIHFLLPPWPRLNYAFVLGPHPAGGPSGSARWSLLAVIWGPHVVLIIQPLSAVCRASPCWVSACSLWSSVNYSLNPCLKVASSVIFVLSQNYKVPFPWVLWRTIRVIFRLLIIGDRRPQVHG